MRLVNLENVQQFTAINLTLDPGHIGGPVIVPNGVKLMIVWNLADAKIGRQILGGIAPGGYVATPTLAEAARSALTSGAAWTALAGFLAPTVSLLRVELLDIRTANQTPVASTGAATPGASAGIALPSEVAAVITLRTGLTGPGNRGRTYVPGWATNAVSAGDVIAPAALTALTNWTTNLSNAVAAAGLTWGLIQPARAAYTGATGTNHPARAAGMRPITSSLVRDNHWDSQRRRGLK